MLPRSVQNAPLILAARDFGAAFAAELEALPLDDWAGPVRLAFQRGIALVPGLHRRSHVCHFDALQGVAAGAVSAPAETCQVWSVLNGAWRRPGVMKIMAMNCGRAVAVFIISSPGSCRS